MSYYTQSTMNRKYIINNEITYILSLCKYENCIILENIEKEDSILMNKELLKSIKTKNKKKKIRKP